MRIQFEKKVILCILTVLLSVSCEKNEPNDLLTGRTWMLDNGLINVFSENLIFCPDKTYLVESHTRLLRSDDYVTATLSGEWTKEDDQIIFLTSMVDLPDDTAAVNVQPLAPGLPAGAFYGYIYQGIYQNDSSLIDSTGSLRFNVIIDRGIFEMESPAQRIWLIQKLTGDSLIVDAEGKTLRYYRAVSVAG